jgi:AcrR family transcriptional regulator
MMLFAEAGYEATTTRAIADRAGVTEAVVFRYFPTKRDLFCGVVETYGPALHYPMAYEEVRALPFAEALAKLAKGYLDHAWANRRCMRIFLLATFQDRQIQRSLGSLYAFRRQRLQEMIEERIAQGELKPEASGYAPEIIALAMTGFLVRTLRSEPSSFGRARDAFVTDLVSTIGRGILMGP